MIQLVANLGGKPLPKPPLWPETPSGAAANDGGWTADTDHP